MQILSRVNLLNLVKSNPNQINAIVIHELGKYNEVAEIVDLCKNAVILEMDDITSDRLGCPTFDHVMTAIKSGYDIVACKMGLSRSAAIAYLIKCQQSTPDEAIKLLDPKVHFPNELILKLGMEIINESNKLPLVEFYKQVAAHKNWKLHLVTKFFRD